MTTTSQKAPLRIVPYKPFSESAKLLAETLGGLTNKRVFRGGPKPDRNNIFWGAVVDWDGPCINNPKAIAIARHKFRTFEALNGKIAIPPYSTSKEVTERWLSEGKVVLSRTNTGQGGSGIIVNVNSIDPAPLYTVYVKKRKEFRVHVAFGNVIHIQEKRKRSGGTVDSLIRSHDNGWVFCIKDIVEPSGLRDAAIGAVNTVGLDFGAVDVIWNEHQNKCYVLEINTAPGLCEQTANIYANSILNSGKLW